MISYNGTVKFRQRKIPIIWTGQYAQHLAERHIENPATHPYLHLSAQKILQVCKVFIKKRNSYIGITEKNNKEVFVI